METEGGDGGADHEKTHPNNTNQVSIHTSQIRSRTETLGPELPKTGAPYIPTVYPATCSDTALNSLHFTF